MATRLTLRLTFAVLPALLIVAVVAACGGPAAQPAATTAPAKPAATTAPAKPAATTAPAAPAATTAPAAPAATKPAAPAATTGAAAPAKAGDVAAGQTVFQQNCNGCHPGGAAGVGPELKGRNLPDDRIRTQVRNGRGQMPPFPESKVSEQQLTDLAAYVQSLK